MNQETLNRRIYKSLCIASHKHQPLRRTCQPSVVKGVLHWQHVPNLGSGLVSSTKETFQPVNSRPLYLFQSKQSLLYSTPVLSAATLHPSRSETPPYCLATIMPFWQIVPSATRPKGIKPPSSQMKKVFPPSPQNSWPLGWQLPALLARILISVWSQ